MKKSLLNKIEKVVDLSLDTYNSKIYFTENPINYQERGKYFFCFHNTHSIYCSFNNQKELEDFCDEYIYNKSEEGKKEHEKAEKKEVKQVKKYFNMCSKIETITEVLFDKEYQYLISEYFFNSSHFEERNRENIFSAFASKFIFYLDKRDPLKIIELLETFEKKYFFDFSKLINIFKNKNLALAFKMNPYNFYNFIINIINNYNYFYTKKNKIKKNENINYDRNITIIITSYLRTLYMRNSKNVTFLTHFEVDKEQKYFDKVLYW